MKGFARFASLILALSLLCLFASCTDKRSEEETTSAQSTAADTSDETHDWGLGIVMPEK